MTSNFYFDALSNDFYKENEVLKYQNPSNFNIITTKLDVEKKITESLSIEAGAKYSYVNNDYTIILKNKNSDGNYILDEKFFNKK